MMDIGSAFLLGVIVGQWITLIACWRAALRMAELDTQDREEDSNRLDRRTMVIDLDEERERRSRF